MHSRVAGGWFLAVRLRCYACAEERAVCAGDSPSSCTRRPACTTPGSRCMFVCMWAQLLGPVVCGCRHVAHDVARLSCLVY